MLLVFCVLCLLFYVLLSLRLKCFPLCSFHYVLSPVFSHSSCLVCLPCLSVEFPWCLPLIISPVPRLVISVCVFSFCLPSSLCLVITAVWCLCGVLCPLGFFSKWYVFFGFWFLIPVFDLYFPFFVGTLFSVFLLLCFFLVLRLSFLCVPGFCGFWLLFNKARFLFPPYPATCLNLHSGPSLNYYTEKELMIEWNRLPYILDSNVYMNVV